PPAQRVRGLGTGRRGPPRGRLMSAGLETLLTQVHLSGAAAVLAAWLERAAQQELSYADFLQGLLDEEVAARSTAATQRRLREAAFPFAATIERRARSSTCHPRRRSRS